MRKNFYTLLILPKKHSSAKKVSLSGSLVKGVTIFMMGLILIMMYFSYDYIHVRRISLQLKNAQSELALLRKQIADPELLRKQNADPELLRKQNAELELLKRQITELELLKKQIAELELLKKQKAELEKQKAVQYSLDPKWIERSPHILASVFTIVLLLWAVLSVGFASAFIAHVPVLRLPLEIDIYLRRVKSKLVRLYLRQLKKNIEQSHIESKLSKMVSLPIKNRNQKSTTKEWIAKVTKRAGEKGHYRAAVIGLGGTGKTILIESIVLQLISQGHIPILFRAVNYNHEKSLNEWTENVLNLAEVPIRPNLLRRVPSLVYVIDQSSEVRKEMQEDFWRLIKSQFDHSIPDIKLIVSGRNLSGTEAGEKLPWNDIVSIDELSDGDIIELGKLYLDSSGKSKEIQGLPYIIRGIMNKPTAFIVSHYVKAIASSAHQITNRTDLFKEIIARNIQGDSLTEENPYRPDVTKLVLQELVHEYYGNGGNRGIPLDDSTLIERISDICNKVLDLKTLYGEECIPKPADFVKRFINSGLVYSTQNSFMFFHDSFEDWLLEECESHKKKHLNKYNLLAESIDHDVITLS